MWVDQESNGPCKKPGVEWENQDCWWTIYFGEVMHYPDGVGDHSNRIATFYVDPMTFKVVAARDWVCGPPLFSLEGFRQLQVRRAKGAKPDDCDGSVPFPVVP
jgi:hypothetical protein